MTAKKTKPGFETDIDKAIDAYVEKMSAVQEGFDPATGEYVAVCDGVEYRFPTRMTVAALDDMDDDASDFDQFKALFPESYEQMRGMQFATFAKVVSGYFSVFEKVQKASLGKFAALSGSGENTGEA